MAHLEGLLNALTCFAGAAVGPYLRLSARAYTILAWSLLITAWGNTIGSVIGPLFDELCRRLDAAGIVPAGPAVAYYEDAPEGGGRISVHAAFPVAAAPPDGELRVVDLPAVEEAATIVHRGPMEAVVPTGQTLARWIDANGYRSAGYPREVNLEVPADRNAWTARWTR